MEKFPLISIIIATFNSAWILKKALDAIEKQTYPREKLEILIIDGGSTDQTKEIAKEFGCTVINNPKTEPISAKILGWKLAKGAYVLTLDHDEVLKNHNSLLNRVTLLQENSGCKVAVVSGYTMPKGYPLLNQYISEFGDPFSLFVYGGSKYEKFYRKYLKKNCVTTKRTDTYCIFAFENTSNLPLMEIACMATLADLLYFKEITNNFEMEDDFVHLFYKMIENGQNTILQLNNDQLDHYSADKIKYYLPKLRWRVRNNVHFAALAKHGFSGRQQYNKKAQAKKLMFLPYAGFFIPAFLHGAYLAVTRMNPVYLLHGFLAFYVLCDIVIQTTLKLFGFKPRLKSYDGKKDI